MESIDAAMVAIKSGFSLKLCGSGGREGQSSLGLLRVGCVSLVCLDMGW